MQSMFDAELSYHGISFDERMAIFSLFREDEELEAALEPCPAGLASKGYLQ